jgi:pyruvate dehydrogenase E2 component (dihydrolipoamide acetyltransferase)
MTIDFKMPDLATTGSAVKILRWLVKPGDAVTRGQFLLEVETDKASMEVEGTANGVFKEALIAEGEAVDAGTVIAQIETSGEGVAAKAVPAAASVSAPAVAAAAPATVVPKKTGGMFARNRAAAAAVSAPEVAPPAPAVTFAAPGSLQKLGIARKTAARRLQQSKQTIPHFYLQTSFNAEPMMARRTAALPHKLAWDAYFVKAMHAAIRRFEMMAYRFEDEQLVPQGTDTIGVAADIDGDLFVVPVEEPGAKSEEDVSRFIRERVAALRSGDPQARVMKPGVMTVTNLGSCNVETFTAIINPPESAILAIGKIRPVVIAVSASAFAIQHRANLTLSVDHRVVNGKYAADFLGAIVEELESL